MSATCHRVREALDAYVDGELRGADLRRVSRHLEICRSCAAEVAARREIGQRLRDAIGESYPRPMPPGLAAGVVARVRAESYFSWRAAVGRAVEDWHWVIVGGGAVTSTCLAMLLGGVLLLLGTVSPNAASLSSLGNNLRSSPGALYAEVSQRGGDVMLVQVATGEDAAGPQPTPWNRADDERALVDALGQTLGEDRGLPHWDAMPDAERRYVEWLFDSITRVRRGESGVSPVAPVTVHRLHLVANADVIAKGLD